MPKRKRRNPGTFTVSQTKTILKNTLMYSESFHDISDLLEPFVNLMSELYESTGDEESRGVGIQLQKIAKHMRRMGN